MAEGEKAFAEAKSTFDNPLAEPKSAPQVGGRADAAEPAPRRPGPPKRRARRDGRIHTATEAPAGEAPSEKKPAKAAAE